MPSARLLRAVLRLLCAATAATFPGVSTGYPLVTRSEWGAHPPATTPLNCTLPVPFIVIHHSYIPAACTTRATCSEAMRAMQHMHQVVNGWNDIGYNFAVGGDGSVYEGRGWDLVGAHAPKYNFMSVGICFIGDYRTELPSASMLHAARQLILDGVDRGSTHPNYTLVGHRQVRETECPGDALFQEIQTWLHWKSVKDIQPRRTVAGPNITSDSNSTVPNLSDSNNTWPNITDNLFDSNNTMPNITDNLFDSNNTDTNITDNLSDGNNTETNITDNLFDSNNTDTNITDNLSDGNNTETNITANLSDSDGTVHGLPP